MKVSDLKYKVNKSQLDEINRFRVAIGMNKILTGTITCCSCNKEFKSPDLKHIKRCKHCKLLEFNYNIELAEAT